jgi:uncharacterized protein (DUF433 family)
LAQHTPKLTNGTLAVREYFCYSCSMFNRIKSDPKVMFGKPVIVGTRITVEHILRCLAAGETPAEIVADYPPLTVEDVRQAQVFAAEHLARETIQ